MRRLALIPALAMAAFGGGCHKQEPQSPQPAPAPASAAAAAPTLAVNRDFGGKRAPDVAITDLASSQPLKLDSLKGKPVLVNLWATWCVPCVKELPTLDALAKAEGGKLQVLAISQDMQGAKVVLPFLKDKKLAGLHPYHDPDNGLMLALKEASLPVSILYDADGKELWRIEGDLDWTGAKAKSLLAEAGV